MSEHFQKIVSFVERLDLDIVHRDDAAEMIVVTNEEKGVYQMVLDCEYPILVIEQLIYEIKNPSRELFLALLKMNRNLIHGAFVVDDREKQVIFRDTLQLANFDFNELEGTINALTLGLAEYSARLLQLNQPSIG